MGSSVSCLWVQGSRGEEVGGLGGPVSGSV